MKTIAARDAKQAHEAVSRRYGLNYTTLETRTGKLEFFSPPQAFRNGEQNRIGTFDPARQTLTFKEA